MKYSNKKDEAVSKVCHAELVEACKRNKLNILR
jgi:hypothetical protein